MSASPHAARFVFLLSVLCFSAAKNLRFENLCRPSQLGDVGLGALGDRGGGFAGVLLFEQAQVTHDGLKQKSTAHSILQLRLRSVRLYSVTFCIDHIAEIA
jgi:hypothetical protein